MSEYVLETKNLGISFGGIKAAQDVNLKIKKNEIYGLIGPNGAGKTTVFNMLTGVYKPTTGSFYLNGEELKGLSQEKINGKGIARTFQNIRLFNNMTVIRNVMAAFTIIIPSLSFPEITYVPSPLITAVVPFTVTALDEQEIALSLRFIATLALLSYSVLLSRSVNIWFLSSAETPA